MKSIFKIIALVGLFLTAAAPVLTFFGSVDPAPNKILMLIGMILWFVGATQWLGRKELQPTDTEVEI